MMTRISVVLIFSVAALLGCGAGGSTESPAVAIPPTDPPVTPPDSVLDTELRALIAEHNLTGDPSLGRVLPQVDDPLVQLGKKLFFSKALGGRIRQCLRQLPPPGSWRRR